LAGSILGGGGKNGLIAHLRTHNDWQVQYSAAVEKMV